MRGSDLRQALEGLRAEADALAEAASAADGKADPVALAEGLLLAVRAAKRLARLREQLQEGARRGP
jgi:hypothetical protein